MNSRPVHRLPVCLNPVRTVVPTTLEVLVEASRWPRAEAQATLPQSISPHGATVMIALPIGFFQFPSIGARGCACTADGATKAKMMESARIRPCCGVGVNGAWPANENRGFSG